MPPRRRRISPVRTLRRLGLYRGVLGGDRAWLGVFVFLTGARAVKKVVARSEEVAAVETLQPGQRVTIVAIDPVAERRAAKRR